MLCELSILVSYFIAVPNAPGIVNVTTLNSTSQTLEWFAIQGHNDGYIVVYYPEYQPQISTIPVVNGEITVSRSNNSKVVVTISDLVPGISYEAEVRTTAGSTHSLPALVQMVTGND